jgi:gas vesicle protein
VERTKLTLTYLGLAVVVGALGAAAGVFWAPASGRETRRRAAKRLTEGRNALVRRGHRVVGETAAFIHDQVQEGARRFRKAVNT